MTQGVIAMLNLAGKDQPQLAALARAINVTTRRTYVCGSKPKQQA